MAGMRAVQRLQQPHKPQETGRPALVHCAERIRATCRGPNAQCLSIYAHTATVVDTAQSWRITRVTTNTVLAEAAQQATH